MPGRPDAHRLWDVIVSNPDHRTFIEERFREAGLGESGRPPRWQGGGVYEAFLSNLAVAYDLPKSRNQFKAWIQDAPGTILGPNVYELLNRLNFLTPDEVTVIYRNPQLADDPDYEFVNVQELTGRVADANSIAPDAAQRWVLTRIHTIGEGYLGDLQSGVETMRDRQDAGTEHAWVLTNGSSAIPAAFVRFAYLSAEGVGRVRTDGIRKGSDMRDTDRTRSHVEAAGVYVTMIYGGSQAARRAIIRESLALLPDGVAVFAKPSTKEGLAATLANGGEPINTDRDDRFGIYELTNLKRKNN